MEFGSRLREIRESQGFTLDDVEQETKIRKLYLNAIENDDYSVLPPRVYAVGFVKRYANFLNLDETEVVEQFKALAYAEEDDDEVQNEYQQPQVRGKPLSQNRFKVKNLVVAIAFVVIVVWLGNWLVGYLANRGIEQSDRSKPPVADQRNPIQTPAPSGKNAIKQTTLSISSNEKCWIRVVVDDVEQFQGFMLAGEQKSFTGQERVYIKAGNAGGLAVLLNDKDIGLLGKTGEVVEYEFLKDGTVRKL